MDHQLKTMSGGKPCTSFSRIETKGWTPQCYHLITKRDWKHRRGPRSGPGAGIFPFLRVLHRWTGSDVSYIPTLGARPLHGRVRQERLNFIVHLPIFAIDWFPNLFRYRRGSRVWSTVPAIDFLTSVRILFTIYSFQIQRFSFYVKYTSTTLLCVSISVLANI